MRKEPYHLYDLFIFIFTFSLFNDKLVVDYFGSYSLKGIFIVFLIIFLFNIKKYLKISSFHNKHFSIFVIFIFLWFIVILLNTIFLSDLDISSNLMKVLAVASIVIFYNSYDINKTLYMIWISMFVSVIDCHFSDTMNQWTFRRAGGTEDPNEFASQLLMTLFISFYLYKQNDNKLFIVFSNIFIIYGLLMAGSKSSFLFLGVLIIYSSVVFYKKLLNLKVILSILLLSSFIVSTQLSKIEAVDNVLNRTQDNHTADARFKLWESGYEMIQNNILLGVGMGNFVENSVEYSTEYLALGEQTAHNMYILWLAENGFIVFFPLMFFLFSLLSSNYSYIIKHNTFFLQLALLSILLMGMSLSASYEKYLWLMIGVYMNIQYLVIQNKQERKIS